MGFLSTQPYKGTRDFYPEDMRLRRWMFDKMRQTAERYGYGEYDGPVLEPFELYAAKTGEEIVNQQLYSFTDRGERKVAIRPEMTPTLARLVAGKINELPKPVRFYSIPNLWRYERPQKGRLREHWQLNIDVLGGDPVMADAEVIRLALDLMDAFGGRDKVSVRVNHRQLMDHLFEKVLQLETSKAHAWFKLLDARAKMGEEAYQTKLSELSIPKAAQDRAEKFFNSRFEQIAKEMDCLGSQTLSQLFDLLSKTGHADRVVYDPTIMRGMDYYTGTVFEIYDISPENNRAMFGGGRYDNLVGLFGKHQLPGVGFGMGDVTLENFLRAHKLIPEFDSGIDVFVTLPDQKLVGESEKIATLMRSKGLRTMTPLDAGGFGHQLKQADKHKAHFAVILGEAELAKGQVVLKNLKTGEQQVLSPEQAALHILKIKSEIKK